MKNMLAQVCPYDCFNSTKINSLSSTTGVSQNFIRESTASFCKQASMVFSLTKQCFNRCSGL